MDVSTHCHHANSLKDCLMPWLTPLAVGNMVANALMMVLPLSSCSCISHGWLPLLHYVNMLSPVAAMLQHHCCFCWLIVAFLFCKIAVTFSFTSCCTTAAVAKVAAPACSVVATTTASHMLLAVAACKLATFAAGWLMLFENFLLLLLVCCCGCHYCCMKPAAAHKVLAAPFIMVIGLCVCCCLLQSLLLSHRTNYSINS